MKSTGIVITHRPLTGCPFIMCRNLATALEIKKDIDNDPQEDDEWQTQPPEVIPEGSYFVCQLN